MGTYRLEYARAVTHEVHAAELFLREFDEVVELLPVRYIGLFV